MRQWLESPRRAPTASRAPSRPTCARPWWTTSATRARIMIATEAGAEGINLQFCSLVVNYDLPWNPQRIEQRIGRCHRYGQKHDVVVVNFLNRNNEADQRVFQLAGREIQAFRGRVRGQRRSARGHRVGRGLREAHRRHLPALPHAGRNQDVVRPTPAGTELADQRGHDPHAPASCWRTSTPRSTTSCGSASTKAGDTSTGTNGC